MVLAPDGDFRRTGCLACFCFGCLVVMSSVFLLDFGFANIGCPDGIRCYPDVAETSRSVCSILRRFVFVVLCAVVLAASWLPLPYGSFILIFGMTMDSGVSVKFCIALAGCGLEVIGGEVQVIVGCVRLDLEFF